MSLEVEVEDQTLGVAKSRVVEKGGRDPDRWIQAVGEPSDLNLRGIAYREFEG
jgi:hypothetical protein